MHGRSLKITLFMTVAAITLAACGNGDEEGSAEDTPAPDEEETEEGAAEDEEPTEEEIVAQQEELAASADLTLWSWVPNIEQIVEIWNEQNPDLQVAVNTQAQGDELVTRLLTATEAGAPPDLFQAEYQALPTLVTNGAAADLSGMLTDEQDLFIPGAWEQVTLGTDSVYAIPQDVGQMMFFYREDVFEEMGLEVPTTWEEFADVAAQVRDQDPDRYLATFSSGDAGWFTGLSQQAGAEWWSISGDAWAVNIDDEPTQRVAEYWQGLVEEDLVDTQSMFTPGWNSALADGSIISWPGAVWSPQVIAGIAEDTEGLWAMSPLPTWGGEEVTGFWGGSTTAISADSPAQEEALRFAVWLNTATEAVDALVEQGGIYPASVEGQESLSDPPPFMPNQPDYFEQAAEIAATARGFTFGPNVNTAYNLYNDSFAQALRGDISFLDAVSAMQEGTVSDLESRGFSVAD